MKKIALISLALISTSVFADEDNRRVVNLSETNRNLRDAQLRSKNLKA